MVNDIYIGVTKVKNNNGDIGVVVSFDDDKIDWYNHRDYNIHSNKRDELTIIRRFKPGGK